MNSSALFDIRSFLMVSVLVTAILSVYAISETFTKRSEVTDELTVVAVHTADRLSSQLVSSLWSIDERTINTSLDSEMKRYELASIQILDPQEKRVLFEKQRGTSVRVGPLVRDEPISESRVVTTEAGENIGTVKVTISQHFLQQKLYTSLQKLGLNVVVLWAVLISVFMILTRQLLFKPVRAICDTVKSLEQGNYKHRLEVNHRNELGELARAVKALQKKMMVTSDS